MAAMTKIVTFDQILHKEGGMRMISKAKFARWCGVSPGSVWTATTRGTLSGVVTKENLINVDHPKAIAYMQAHGLEEAPAEDEEDDFEQEREAGISPKFEMEAVDKDRLQHLTLGQITRRWGSVAGFKSYVDSLKSIAEYQQRDIRIQVMRGELIERDFVEFRLFPVVDLAFQRIVGDMPDVLAKQIVSRVQSGGGDITLDVQNIIKDRASQILNDMKRSIKELGVLNTPY